MGPANALSLEVKAALLDHLGDYKVGEVVKAKAYFPVASGNALVAEGLNPTWRPVGLEAIFALYPSDWDGTPEFGADLSGFVHHELVLKAYGGSTWDAREALMRAFPLLTTRFAKKPRYTPGGSGFIETLTMFIPVEL